MAHLKIHRPAEGMKTAPWSAKTQRIHAWLESCILGLHQFAICESSVLQRHMKHALVCVETLIKCLDKLTKCVELKFSAKLPDKFAPICDSWSSANSHYVATLFYFLATICVLPCGARARIGLQSCGVLDLGEWKRIDRRAVRKLYRFRRRHFLEVLWKCYMPNWRQLCSKDGLQKTGVSALSVVLVIGSTSQSRILSVILTKTSSSKFKQYCRSSGTLFFRKQFFGTHYWKQFLVPKRGGVRYCRCCDCTNEFANFVLIWKLVTLTNIYCPRVEIVLSIFLYRSLLSSIQ